MADGTQTEVMVYNPFLVIDGVGYKTKYEPCEALNDNTCNRTLLGTYSWQCKNNDGTFTNMEADSAHPLECADLLPPFKTTETSAFFRFAEEPDTILSVRCWSDEHWSDPAADSENVSVNGNEIDAIHAEGGKAGLQLWQGSLAVGMDQTAQIMVASDMPVSP